MKWTKVGEKSTPVWLHNCTLGCILDVYKNKVRSGSELSHTVDEYLDFSELVANIVQRWIEDPKGLEELAYLLNNRKERLGQIFEEAIGGLYYVTEDETHFNTTYKEGELYDNSHNESKKVKGLDIH